MHASLRTLDSLDKLGVVLGCNFRGGFGYGGRCTAIVRELRFGFEAILFLVVS